LLIPIGPRFLINERCSRAEVKPNSKGKEGERGRGVEGAELRKGLESGNLVYW